VERPAGGHGFSPLVATDLPTDLSFERRRAIVLAHHFRDPEGVSIAQTAESLGRNSTAGAESAAYGKLRTDPRIPAGR
jgi:hypothetical protein